MLDLVQRWVIVTNNYGNLHCEKCSAGCNLPMGSTVFRRKRYDLKIDDLNLFLETIPAQQEIRLTGGETTCMPMKTVVKMMDAIQTHGHRSSLLTNGYALPELLEETTLYHVTLNNHGTNQKRVDECVIALERHGIMYEVIETKHHYDLWEASKHNDGGRCDQWFTKPALYDRVLYPCCSLMFVKGGSRLLWHELYRHGWNIYNPDWLKLFEKADYPQIVDKTCLEDCYMPGMKKTKPFIITRKHNDVLRPIR